MRRSSKLGACAAVLALSLMSVGVSLAVAAAAPKEACVLVPASALAGDLGLPHVVERASSTPDTGSGGRLTRCRIAAWSGVESKATVAAGTRARLTIETTEEDVGSPFAANWTKGGAEEARSRQEELLEEESMFGSGYYTRSNVGYALWDRKKVDEPTYNTTQEGIRNIFATWRASQPIGRSVTLNLFVDEHKRAFAELNRVAESVVGAFTISAGEFGSPGAPAPEPRSRGAGFHMCRGAHVKVHGDSYDEFIVKGTSCQTAVEVMRAWLAAGGPFHGPSGPTHGWSVFDQQPIGEVTGSKGHARFVCVPSEDPP
jgi:hypothetical protein